MKKQIIKIVAADRSKVGEHFMLQPLPSHDVDALDPFLLLHHHGPHTFAPYNQGLPFGPHPHRGFETLTFIYEGDIEHADSQGFTSTIHSGGVQWMTAGRGIVHSENISAQMRENGGNMEIIQLWMNLPKKLKMTPPNYQGFQSAEIPVVKSTDGLVENQVISGVLAGVAGAAKSLTGLQIYNVKAQKGAQFTYPVDADTNVLFYVLNGELKVNGKLATGRQMVIFDTKAGDIEIEADTESRFIVCIGNVINEPVVSQGPFVMNTTSEILQAIRDYQMGKMGVM